MKHSPAKFLLASFLPAICSPSFTGSIILGVNFEFVDGRFSDEAFDGGWGVHPGYEFKEWKKWQLAPCLNTWMAGTTSKIWKFLPPSV